MLLNVNQLVPPVSAFQLSDRPPLFPMWIVCVPVLPACNVPKSMLVELTVSLDGMHVHLMLAVLAGPWKAKAALGGQAAVGTVTTTCNGWPANNTPSDGKNVTPVRYGLAADQFASP
jgi:hypothetical protein